MGKNKRGIFDAGKTTKTGEMIPSMFNWITPDIQAQVADKLAKSTEKK